MYNSTGLRTTGGTNTSGFVQSSIRKRVPSGDVLRKRRKIEPVHIETSTAAIQLVTFGYKHGIVENLDYYYDLRKLPNDAWIVENYKNKNARDSTDIQHLIFQNERMRNEYCKLKQDIIINVSSKLLDVGEVINIGIGCKSGLHRSVSFAEKLYSDLIKDNSSNSNLDDTNSNNCICNNKILEIIHLDIATTDNNNEKITCATGTSELKNSNGFQRRHDDQFICKICKNLKCNDAKQMNEHLKSKSHRKKLVKHAKKKIKEMAKS